MHPEDDQNELDALIRRALDVQTDDEQLARLERFWREQSAVELERHRWQPTWQLGAAAAVAAVLMVGLFFIANRQRTDVPAPQQARTVPLELPTRSETESPAVPIAVAPITVEPIVAVEPPSSIGRTPTPYERFMFIARTGPQASTPVASVGAVIDDLLARVTSGPEVELHRELDATGIDLRQAETVLLRKISRSTVNEQRAIVRVLAHCGSRRSMPALLKLARREAIRDEALASLESIVGLERLAAQLDVAGDEHVRQAIIERLLAADSEAARRAYLSLVANESTRREALAVARQLPEPPINSWLENLDDDDESVRLSAALVLSTVNGPEVTRSLIDRVTARPADSTEAWIALLGCRGEMADEFCAYAMQRPKLLGYFNGARLRWARMTP